ncbi:hypothetical protein B0H12DRAFT_1319486 [Mycena haematopus]|nr:hypothetical protein B0H12DRAFT_1319486 [Mycena haematopus]
MHFQPSASGFLAGASTALVWVFYKDYLKERFAAAVAVLIYLFAVIWTTTLAVVLNFLWLVVLFEVAGYLPVLMLDDQLAGEDKDEVDSIPGAYVFTSGHSPVLMLDDQPVGEDTDEVDSIPGAHVFASPEANADNSTIDPSASDETLINDDRGPQVDKAFSAPNSIHDDAHELVPASVLVPALLNVVVLVPSTEDLLAHDSGPQTHSTGVALIDSEPLSKFVLDLSPGQNAILPHTKTDTSGVFKKTSFPSSASIVAIPTKKKNKIRFTFKIRSSARRFSVLLSHHVSFVLSPWISWLYFYLLRFPTCITIYDTRNATISHPSFSATARATIPLQPSARTSSQSQRRTNPLAHNNSISRTTF